MKKIIEIKNLTKYYGKTKGVENLNIDIYEGEIFGFVGPNGAGKSTTIRCIMNMINKTSGEININGMLLSKNNYKIKEIIGYLPSEIHLYDDFTVKQMLDYASSFYVKDSSIRRNELVKKLKLDINKKVDELSYGNLKKLGIILALMHEPKILILDEATSGLDPLMQEVFYELLLEEKEKGTTIFFSSHILSEIKKVCNRVAIIKDGHLEKIEDITSLKDNNLEIITMKSKDVDIIIKDLNIKPFFQEKDSIRFMYKESINKLIDKIKKYDIEKLLIEDPSIEDIFMHYYK